MSLHGNRAFILLPVAIALISGVFFRFHNLDRKVYWNDEIWTSLWLTGKTSQEFEAALPAGPTTAGALNGILFASGDRGPLSTVAAIAAEDPKQPALYMLLARLWADAFGRSPGTVRALSAVLSLLALIPLFGLCRELFPDRNAAWTAIGLAAVSPFQVLYAQEARPYSLWILAVLTSSLMLLRALRGRSRFAWFGYGLSLAIGLFSQTLFALTIAGHALFVLSRRGGVPVEGHRAWIRSAAIGLTLFLPWAFLIVMRLDRLAHNTGWVARSSGFPFLLSRWATGLASPFVDYGMGGPVQILTALAVLGLVAWAWVALNREDRQAGFFVTTLMLPSIVFLMIPDLVLRGGGLSTPRFLVPLLLGMQIAVAAFSSRGKRIGLLVILLGAGLYSCLRIGAADTWWTKYLNADAPAIARVVNAGHHPLVVGRSKGLDVRRVLALCGKLGPDVEIQLLRDEIEVQPFYGLRGPDGEYRDVFFHAGRPPLPEGGKLHIETSRHPEPLGQHVWKLPGAPSQIGPRP